MEGDVVWFRGVGKSGISSNWLRFSLELNLWVRGAIVVPATARCGILFTLLLFNYGVFYFINSYCLTSCIN